MSAASVVATLSTTPAIHNQAGISWLCVTGSCHLKIKCLFLPPDACCGNTCTLKHITKIDRRRSDLSCTLMFPKITGFKTYYCGTLKAIGLQWCASSSDRGLLCWNIIPLFIIMTATLEILKMARQVAGRAPHLLLPWWWCTCTQHVVEDIPHALFCCAAHALLRASFLGYLRGLVGASLLGAFMRFSPICWSVALLRDDFMSSIANSTTIHCCVYNYLVVTVSHRIEIVRWNWLYQMLLVVPSACLSVKDIMSLYDLAWF